MFENDPNLSRPEYVKAMVRDVTWFIGVLKKLDQQYYNGTDEIQSKMSDNEYDYCKKLLKAYIYYWPTPEAEEYLSTVGAPV